MRKDYLAFFISLFLSRLADQILLFIVPLVVFQTTNSAAWAGLAFFVKWLPRYLAFPLCGALCDKYSPIKILPISQVYLALLCVQRRQRQLRRSAGCGSGHDDHHPVFPRPSGAAPAAAERCRLFDDRHGGLDLRLEPKPRRLCAGFSADYRLRQDVQRLPAHPPATRDPTPGLRQDRGRVGVVREDTAWGRWALIQTR